MGRTRAQVLRRRRLLAVALVVGLFTAAGVAVYSGAGDVVVRERCRATTDDGEYAFTPEQSANAALIAAVSARRALPARAATIGIATAIQESKLENIDYGDRDSLGLFQQRPSQGWGTPAQVQDPLYATEAFYDVLEDIEGFGDLEVTDAAQQVQRSAFPSAYADHEAEARAFASALTGYSPGALTCRLRSPEDPGDPAEVVADLRAQWGIDDAVVDGRSVRITARGETAERRAWAVAQWGVARAGTSGVTGVATADRIWRRDDPAAGWATGPDLAPGVVVLSFATT